MRKGRRRRRASLRGWWRVLPFVVLGTLTYFSFIWLHSKHLRNEYRAIELKAEIEHTKERIAELLGKGYELGSMERMEDVAPDALKPAAPGQIEVVRATPAELESIAAAARPAPPSPRPTRSVLVLLDGGTTAVPPAAMAQVGAPPGASEADKL